MQNKGKALTGIPEELLRGCEGKEQEITITGAQSVVIYVGGLQVTIKNSRPGGLLQ